MPVISGDAFTTQPDPTLGLITETHLAALLNVKPTTLQAWRAALTGPDFVRLGKGVFYRQADVEEWIATKVTLTNRTA